MLVLLEYDALIGPQAFEHAHFFRRKALKKNFLANFLPARIKMAHAWASHRACTSASPFCSVSSYSLDGFES